MVIYSREKVARLREQYPAGTRICLDSMDGEAGMPQGLEGTVQYILIIIFIFGNESNEIFQENSQSKIYRPDGSLQVFRGSLPDFVAGAAVRPVSLWR